MRFTHTKLCLRLFAQTEYETVTLKTTGNHFFTDVNVTVPGVYLGVGAIQRITQNAGLFFMLRYNVIYDNQRAIYPNPDYRVGFNVGI